MSVTPYPIAPAQEHYVLNRRLNGLPPLKIGDNITFKITSETPNRFVKFVPVDAPVSVVPGKKGGMHSATNANVFYEPSTSEWLEIQEWIRTETSTRYERYYVSEIKDTKVYMAHSSNGYTMGLVGTWVDSVLELKGDLSKLPYSYRFQAVSGNPYPERVLDEKAVEDAVRARDQPYLQWIFQHTGLIPGPREIIDAAARGDEWLFYDMWNYAQFSPNGVVNWAAANAHWKLTQFLVEHGDEVTKGAPNMVALEPDENYESVLATLKGRYKVEPTIARERWGSPHP